MHKVGSKQKIKVSDTVEIEVTVPRFIVARGYMRALNKIAFDEKKRKDDASLDYLDLSIDVEKTNEETGEKYKEKDVVRMESDACDQALCDLLDQMLDDLEVSEEDRTKIFDACLDLQAPNRIATELFLSDAEKKD